MKVAIAGYGIEGKASFKYWQSLGAELTIVDEREVIDDLPSGVPAILGIGVFEKLQGFDLVVRTASLRPDRIYTDGQKWSATNEFFAKCPAPIIGVTGTKGKGTTCSLIASILRASGKTVHLVGNIGTPALEALPDIKPDDVVVYELSSFQLWDLELSPHTAVILPIEPDHLDVHMSLDEYVDAKSNIARHQTVKDEVIYHGSNQYSVRIANASVAAIRRKYPFDIGSLASSLRIPGEHNRENASAAIAAVALYVSDIEVIKKGLAAFDGLPHRLKFVREVAGVRYFDDSYSSAPAASIAAIRALKEPQIVLLGGYDKGADFSALANELRDSSVKKAVVYGQTRMKIAEALAKAGVGEERYQIVNSQDFDEIVTGAASQAGQGDVVVLSPGCASFDMFNNFTHRGEEFIRIVEAL